MGEFEGPNLFIFMDEGAEFLFPDFSKLIGGFSISDGRYLLPRRNHFEEIFYERLGV